MSELVRFSSGDNDVAKRTQVDPQNPTAKFVPLEPGQVLFGLEVVEDGSLLGTIYYDYKDKNGIITRVSMGNGGAGGPGGGGLIKTLATTDGTHDGEEVTAAANVIIPLPKKIFANLLSAKTQFNFPKVHDPSNTAYVNEDAAPGQSYLYGNGLHMVNPFNTLQDSWIRTIGKQGSAEATLELAMRDNASSEYIYDQIVARHYKADGTVVTDKNGRKREVVILGKNGESYFPGPVTSDGGFVGDLTGNATSATKARNDWYNQVIDSTYLSKIIKTKNDGSVFEITSYDGRYTPVGAADAKKDVITIPGATTAIAGLITTGNQTITGNKTIDGNGSLTVAKAGGFIYSGIQEDKTTNANIPLWFATSGTNGTPKYSTELTYNPSTGTVTAKKFAGPATSATYDAEGGAIHDKYLKRAGGTMTGALNFADNTYNKFGDDVEVGSRNATGKLTIHGLNGATGIVFAPYSGSTSQTISIDGAGVMTITGTLKATLDGNASTATKLQTARNFNITDSSAAYSGPNASFDGSANVTLHMPDTFAGSLKGNADTATKLATARTLWGQSFNGTANVSGNMTGVGNVTSTTSNTYTLGTSSNLWKAVYATTFYGALSGNADTATKLQTARSFHITDSSATYNGASVTFDGSAAVTLHMPDTFVGTLKGNADTATKATKLSNARANITTQADLDAFLEGNVLQYATVGNNIGVNSDGMVISLGWSNSFWGHQIFADDSAMVMQHRHRLQKTNDDGSNTYAWSAWATLLDSSNYTNYTVKKDGTGATGTWNISISGNAATATQAQSALKDGDLNEITTTYLKKSGGTMTGALNFANGTYNKVGDDVEIGDKNTAGKLFIHGINGTTGIVFAPYSGSTSQTLSIDGAGVMTITGTLKTTLDGNASTATKLANARTFHITDTSATYNGPNASFDGSANVTLHMPSTFAGTLKGNADTATNADKVDGYHMGEEKWTHTNDFSQPTANTTWYLKISTAAWNSTSETIYIRCTGDNKNGTVILKTGSRQANWWGYATSYNTTGITGVKKVISNSDDVYIKIDASITKVTIKTTFSPTITSTTDTANYVDVPGNGGFFANVVNATTFNGSLNGNASSANKWATARNFQVDLALDNPATVKVDGSTDVILPITGILGTAHGGTGNSSFTANRLVWTETATKMTAGYHYADSARVGVNYTSKPSTNFRVGGTSYLDGDTTINGEVYMVKSNAAITWNQGTYWQRMITEDDSTSGTHIFKFQVSSNSGSSWTDILRLANNGQVRVQNNIGGIYKLQTTASTVAAVQVISDNQDSSIFKVASGTEFADSWSVGFDLKYIGTGAGVDNLLTLYAGDYANTQTQVIGWSVNQAGQMGIRTTPNTSYSLNINGNTYSNGKFYINNTSNASLSADGAIVIGPTNGENLTLDTNEIMARSNKAASTLHLNNEGGLVQIGSGGLLVNGQMKTTGPLLIGSDANGRTKNYIAFYGITGDGPDTWNHTFIGENLFGDTDKSELILFKGNDPGSSPEDMRYASGPGPDRIRHIAAGHLFQIYRSALSGTFATIAQSTVPISIFEVNQQGVVVYNEGTDANNYPAKITFRVKDTVNGTTSTATIAAYSDHGTASYGSNLVITSGGNTLVQAGDGTYGSYAHLIGTGVNQGENLYLTADNNVILCATADTINRQLIWNGTTFYPVLNNTFNLGGSANRWASAHVYRDFNIYGNESTGDESHVRFNASDNSQRAIIAFNGNTTNTLDATTHLKIATNYGDIRLDAASNYINVKGHILPRADFTATNYNIGSTTRRWGNVYANALRLQGPASDPSEAQGARIEFAYDNGSNRSQPVYISYTPNDGYRVPYGLKIFGTEATNYGAWLEVQGAIGTSSTNLSSGIGYSLYNGPVNGKPTYGIFFGATGTFGKLYNTSSSAYGISGDCATYFTMSDTANRGWLFMRGSTNVAGISGVGSFVSTVSTASHIAGNQGKVIIDGTAAAGYNMLFRQKSTNGVFTGGAYNAEWNIYYTTNTIVSAGTNSTTYGIRLINESGNTRLNRLGINGENTSYQFYVNGTSLFNSTLTSNGQIVSKVAAGTPPFVITSNTVNANLNADLLDGYHENTFLRYRDSSSGSGGTSHANSLWSQIGIRQYNNALPDALPDSATYTYGAVVSLPGASSRFDLWYTHTTSTSGQGLRYRTGWNDDKQAWATIIDNLNYATHLDGRYVNVTGDTMTGALNFANGTWNKVGDDAQFGDNNTAGSFAIQGINGNTNLKMVTYNNTTYGTITWNGSSFLLSHRLYFSHAGTWATTVNYANSLINFGTRSNAQSSGTLYYFPWMGGYDAVSGAGYYNTVTMGLYHGIPSNAGFFIGMSWDGNNADTFYYFSRTGDFTAPRVRNAVWNDYAECRAASTEEPGRVVIETSTGIMRKSTDRLQAGASVVSDTYGTLMGETELCKTPIAVAGRVLVYTNEDRDSYPLGAAVCTGPNGTVSLMTREEVREYPERIVGTVSEIPKYETWGTGNVKVNGRIWIKVR